MLKSMTGFGSATLENTKFRISVDIKSLNSKFLDINVRIPRTFNDKEIEIRNLISEALVRGKVGISIEFQELSASEPKVSINKALVKEYVTQLRDVANELNTNDSEIFKLAIGMPQAVENVVGDSSNEEEWTALKTVIQEALDKCNQFRLTEGQTLQSKIQKNIEVIDDLLVKVNEQDPIRVENLRKRVSGRIAEFLADENIDKNRFEQEMIYYIEKLDITEEKVRLKTHLDYFLTTITSKKANGKKLNFIAQEIGREINTTGSKANDVNIQHHVVQMKEELEQIKEQLSNIL